MQQIQIATTQLQQQQKQQFEQKFSSSNDFLNLLVTQNLQSGIAQQQISPQTHQTFLPQTTTTNISRNFLNPPSTTATNQVLLQFLLQQKKQNNKIALNPLLQQQVNIKPAQFVASESSFQPITTNNSEFLTTNNFGFATTTNNSAFSTTNSNSGFSTTTNSNSGFSTTTTNSNSEFLKTETNNLEFATTINKSKKLSENVKSSKRFGGKLQKYDEMPLLLPQKETQKLSPTKKSTIKSEERVQALRLPYSSESCHTITKFLMTFNLVKIILIFLKKNF